MGNWVSRKQATEIINATFSMFHYGLMAMPDMGIKNTKEKEDFLRAAWKLDETIHTDDYADTVNALDTTGFKEYYNLIGAFAKKYKIANWQDYNEYEPVLIEHLNEELGRHEKTEEKLELINSFHDEELCSETFPSASKIRVLYDILDDCFVLDNKENGINRILRTFNENDKTAFITKIQSDDKLLASFIKKVNGGEKDEMLATIGEIFISSGFIKDRKTVLLDNKKTDTLTASLNKGKIYIKMESLAESTNLVPGGMGDYPNISRRTVTVSPFDIVNMNYAAVEKGVSSLHKVAVPAAWANAEDSQICNSHLPPYVRNVLIPINRQEGDALKVSTFKGVEDGRMPNCTSRYEKRGVAVEVPHWIKENCIQCNQCSFVCPHATIRPFLLNEKERAAKPEGFETIKANGKGLEGLEYRMQVSVMDCTGCSNCANICPAKNKALVMKPLAEEEAQSKNWDYAVDNVSTKHGLMDQFSVKGSQFKQPLLEFHGACAGCGETAYATLVTRLFGDRMMIANASGCSSIWGGSYPTAGFTYNEKGKGPTWASSLFEDNANYGYGMALGTRKLREQAEDYMKKFIELNVGTDFTPLFKEWIENKKDVEANTLTCDKIKALFDAHQAPRNMAVKNTDAADYLPVPESHTFKYDTGNIEADRLLEYIYKLKDFIVKKSVWSFGGDGWAYDIGYGGLDHTMASGEDFNILVFDTEVYSNTGGQSSKSTPTAAVAKFAAGGKQIRKKDLGAMLMTYGYVYVAQVAIGSNMSQFVKAVKEAESYDGPSIVICYAPCINHGLRSGMSRSVEQEKKAVEAGYWHLYRFDPRLKAEGKNPFQLDSKEPTASFQDFINSEVRYTSLKKTFPDVAEVLFKRAEEDAKERYDRYKRLAE